MAREKREALMLVPKKREPIIITKTPGRNDPCRCGSGEKYKKCHYNYDQRVINGQEEV